jgi:hypothetical protein
LNISVYFIAEQTAVSALAYRFYMCMIWVPLLYSEMPFSFRVKAAPMRRVLVNGRPIVAFRAVVRAICEGTGDGVVTCQDAVGRYKPKGSWRVMYTVAF